MIAVVELPSQDLWAVISASLAIGLTVLAIVVRLRRPSKVDNVDSSYSEIMVDSVRRTVTQEIDRLGSFQGRIVDQIESALSKQQRDQTTSIGSSGSELLEEIRSLILDRPELGNNELLVREISHSLGTPLAGIRANVELIESQLIDSLDDPSLARRATSIKVAVDLCQSFLLAFRRLTGAAEPGALFQSMSFRDAVSSVLDFYRSVSNHSIVERVDLPDEIPGYSSAFLLALLGPLIENAVEATEDGAMVGVELETRPDSLQFSISNSTQTPPPSVDVWEQGFSTKENHQGLGLPIVLRLANSVGGSVGFDVDQLLVNFSVTLPARKSAT